MREKNSFINSFLLFITAVIWGTSFVAQSAGLEYIGPFTFSFIRYILGGAILVPVILLSKKNITTSIFKKSIKHGLVCGIILCFASNFQQMAMLKASAGKAGFITALYIIIVPVISVFLKKNNTIIIWICVFLSVLGLYFLCIGRNGNYVFEISDIFLLICSVIFSIHIIYIDYANEQGINGIIMSSTQFFTAAIISSVFIFFIDGKIYKLYPDYEMIRNAFPALCYSGFMACGVAYTLQILGQKNVNPTVASIIMSLESVVSAISGFLILKQKMSIDEVVGCIIIFVAIILAQLPISKKNN